MITASAYAKLNLYLDVVARRPDGFHDIETVMQQISLADTFSLSFDLNEHRKFSGNISLGLGDDNLCWKAVRYFYEALHEEPCNIGINLFKRIPIGAGMGGGSADAAAILKILNKKNGFPFTVPQLCEIGASVGSDVPFCVLGGTAHAAGKGEILTPIPAETVLHYVVCKPDVFVSTPDMYRRIDELGIRPKLNADAMLSAIVSSDLREIAAAMYNAFEAPAIAFAPEIGIVKQKLLDVGALNAMMTGSGSAVFGLYENAETAALAFESLKRSNLNVFLCESIL